MLSSSAPCLPPDVEVEVNCNSDGAAVVTWNTTGTANFSLTAIVSGSLQTLCTSRHNRCNVTNLACGETYNLSLTAINDQCSLTTLMPANLTTREWMVYSSSSFVANVSLCCMCSRFEPLSFLTSLQALVRLSAWVLTCSVAPALQSCPGRRILMSNCTRQLPSGHQEER